MVKRKGRQKKTGPQPYSYYFKILAWYIECSNTYEWKVVRERDSDAGLSMAHEIRETKVDHHHSIRVEVDLLNPVKKVVGGALIIDCFRKVELETDRYPENIRYERRPQDDGGGSLWSRWNEEREHRIASGLVRVDECSFLSLVQVLTSDRTVIIKLHGEEFYRNKARIRSVRWFLEGDPNKQEDLEYAVGQSTAVG